MTGKREILHPFLKKVERGPWELMTCQPHLCAWEDRGTDPPRRYAKHMEDSKVTRDSQDGFTKDKYCLTNLVAFYNRITISVDKEKVMSVIYLDFCKVFDTGRFGGLFSGLFGG